MLLEIAAGDAYGACFEGTGTLDHIREHNNLEYNNVLPSLVKMGCYTDDTQMTLAIAENILDDGEWDRESLANKFVECFHRDQRRGYTSAFLILLMNSPNGKELLSRIGGDSSKSGAAMRAGPIGLYPDLREVEKKAILQAHVTHRSMIGEASSQYAAFMVHYFAYDLGPKNQLCEWLEGFYGPVVHSKEDFFFKSGEIRVWFPELNKPVPCDGWACVEAALYAIENSNTLSEVLKTAVSYGGDTDTVATIAMAAACWSKELKQDLPPNLISGLEDGKYGRQYIQDLDTRLRAKFNL